MKFEKWQTHHNGTYCFLGQDKIRLCQLQRAGFPDQRPNQGMPIVPGDMQNLFTKQINFEYNFIDIKTYYADIAGDHEILEKKFTKLITKINLRNRNTFSSYLF